ncbi:gastrula zinc finger protein XlCGF49.1-like [Takifugu rubripes]|uniref:gastrula zinc finger protein XlCGF49.1-like n=1 Tax=Takifugu rubripes TaxID=31033 RepID=UPI001145FA66|nr:gastrula zinc finger protein XlCGF49.1-like [Takifugu rubripes]
MRFLDNPLREEPGHSLALNATVGVSSDSGGGGLSLKEAAGAREAPGRRRQGFWSRSGGGSSRAFVCNCCGKTLASLKNLNTHMRVHTGEKPFVCALCGKRFSDPSNLKRHQSVHTGEKRYGCVHCGKRFAQSGSLKVHMSVHTDCKQFRCSSCGKTFISGSHLRRHAAMHAAVHATERERPPPFSDH